MRKLARPLGTFIEEENPKEQDKYHDRGEELGGFKFGSTVVLVFEAPDGFEFDLVQGQRVQLGNALGRIRHRASAP